MQFSVIELVKAPASKDIDSVIIEVGTILKEMLDKKAMMNGVLVSLLSK